MGRGGELARRFVLSRGGESNHGKALTVYTDGAARGNPGPAAIGVVAMAGKREVFRISRCIGVATNNVAEYMAVIAGLEEAAGLNASEVTVMMDSELVQRQMVGGYKVKAPRLKELHLRASTAARRFDRCAFVHVPRGGNALADRLANEALDEALKGPGRDATT
jgi:ribonuclease HI